MASRLEAFLLHNRLHRDLNNPTPLSLSNHMVRLLRLALYALFATSSTVLASDARSAASVPSVPSSPVPKGIAEASSAVNPLEAGPADLSQARYVVSVR